MATQVEVPALGESVTQAILVSWRKADGERVEVDEPLCELETDKANVDIPSPAAGVLRHVRQEGDTVAVGETVASIEETPAAAKPSPQPSPLPREGEASARSASVRKAEAAGSVPSPEADDLARASRHPLDTARPAPPDSFGSPTGTEPPVAGVIPQVVEATLPAAVPEPPRQSLPQPPGPKPPVSPVAPKAPVVPPMIFDAQGTHRSPMSKIRQRIAQTLVQAQHTAAILTTFNEIDMSAVSDLRGKWKHRFEEVHNVGLGFMSFFAKAAAQALREMPRLNAFVDGTDIVYHNYVHLGIAVSTDRGLAVPVLRNVQGMSFARIEAEVKRLAQATREGRLSVEELSGGTFTVTNGGVFGSLLSTPILNPPQSGILGLHAIQKRPVVVEDRIEIRPMMYVALSYDHRIVDGREAIGFLVRVKQLVEDPARLMLEI